MIIGIIFNNINDLNNNIMIKKISIGMLALALSTSCVSKKIYYDLENKFADLKKENRAISDENAEND